MQFGLLVILKQLLLCLRDSTRMKSRNHVLLSIICQNQLIKLSCIRNITNEKLSTQLLIKIKQHNYGDICLLDTFSHLQAVIYKVCKLPAVQMEMLWFQQSCSFVLAGPVWWTAGVAHTSACHCCTFAIAYSLL